MELPYADMSMQNFAWLRTWHGGKPHFDYQFNNDGSISPAGRLDLVFGLADPTPCGRWKDVIARHVSWNTRRPLPQAAQEETKQEPVPKSNIQSNHPEVLQPEV